MEDKDINGLAESWGFKAPVSAEQPPAEFVESPAGVEERYLLTCSNQKLYVLEGFQPSLLFEKERVAIILEELDNRKQVPVIPMIKSINKNYFVPFNNLFWQLREYRTGDRLPRPEYAGDGWRGAAAADLIKQISSIDRISTDLVLPEFPMAGFIGNFKKKLKNKNPEILEKKGYLFDKLENEILKRVHKLPVKFSHGDFHPLNIIWGGKKVKAVLDWEFSGLRPIGFDAANFIGAVGFENPDLLGSKLVETMLDNLIKSDYLNNEITEIFKEMIIITRLMWLSNWLRQNEREMIHLELEYLNLLEKLKWKF